MRDPNEKVVVAYLRPQTVHGDFAECVMDLLLYDVAMHRRIVEGGGRLSFRAGCNLAGPRNEVVKSFLRYGKADWLWFVDSDMTFAPDTVERLLEHADPETAPIVGGLCFALNDKGDIVPTLYGLAGDPRNPDVTQYNEYPVDTMFQVVATGGACLLIHRSVFERFLAYEPPQRPGQRGFNGAYPWFQETEHDGRPVSEDITFCWRAGVLEIPVYVNTAVQVGHIKDRVLNAASYDLARGMFATLAEAAAEREQVPA
jgi:hypothetical protein